MKYLIFLISILLLSLNSNAQDLTPKETVIAFFDAMNKRDTTDLKSFFAPQVHMATTFQNKQDSTIVVYGDLQEFLTSIGKKDENVFEEKTFNYKVNIDGALSQVWCDYQFILNGKLSHCGVDAFHLLRIDKQWKITHLADTRRTNNCAAK